MGLPLIFILVKGVHDVIYLGDCLVVVEQVRASGRPASEVISVVKVVPS